MGGVSAGAPIFLVFMKGKVPMPKSSGFQNYIAIYSGVVTLAFGGLLLTGADAPRNARFDTIDVQRINVREADGTLRMVVSNEGRFPGAIFQGREYRHPRDAAGMIFYNDEGTENGGLIFNGAKDANDKIRSGGHLSFDPYDRDQVVALQQIEEDGKLVRAGLVISDKGTGSAEAMFREKPRFDAMTPEARDKAYTEMAERGEFNNPRLFVGKNARDASVLDLRDGKGKTRLRLQVAADGTAQILFMDAAGKVQRTMTPDDLAAK